VNWDGWQEFLAMGGYGLYVWGSYVVTFVLLVIELAGLANRRKALAQQMSRQPMPDKLKAANEV